eukprot:Pompholyxophrys_sp_v1_NODE_2_length_20472_cov_5.132586.p4 type:complete len:414 gc:universal NODE_2_length_20472_cov_5.132586:6908-8149(+)
MNSSLLKTKKMNLLHVYNVIDKRCKNYVPKLHHIEKDVKIIEHIRKTLSERDIEKEEDLLGNILNFRNFFNDLTKSFTTKQETLYFMEFFFNRLLTMKSSDTYWSSTFIYSNERNTCKVILYMVELYHLMSDFQKYVVECNASYRKNKYKKYFKNVNVNFLNRSMIEPSLENLLNSIHVFFTKFHFDNDFVLPILTEQICRNQKRFIIPSIKWHEVLVSLFQDIYGIHYIAFCDFSFDNKYKYNIIYDDLIHYDIKGLIKEIYIVMMKDISDMKKWESIVGEDDLLTHQLLTHPSHFLYKNPSKQNETWLDKARFNYCDHSSEEKKVHFWEIKQTAVFNRYRVLDDLKISSQKHISSSNIEKSHIHSLNPLSWGGDLEIEHPDIIKKKTKRMKTKTKLRQELRSRQKISYQKR